MPNVLDEVRQLLDGIEKEAEPAAKLAQVPEQIIERVYHTATADLGDVLGSSAAASAEAAAEDFIHLAKFANGLAAINAVTSLLQVKEWLKAAFGKLPRVIGKPAARLLDLLIFPLESMISGIADNLAGSAKTILHSHIRATAWSVNQSGLINELLRGTVFDQNTQPPLPPPAVQHHANYATENELQQLRRQVTRLEYALGIAENKSQVPRQVWDQIHALQHGLHQQTLYMQQLETKLDHALSNIGSVQHQIDTLSAQLGNLRQISVGWTEVQQDIMQLQTTVTRTMNDLRVRQHHDEQNVAQLAPLGLLLQPGIRGLQTLRQLEDTPCMCPRFANIPNELGTALAVMEFVENG